MRHVIKKQILTPIMIFISDATSSRYYEGINLVFFSHQVKFNPLNFMFANTRGEISTS